MSTVSSRSPPLSGSPERSSASDVRIIQELYQRRGVVVKQSKLSIFLHSRRNHPFVDTEYNELGYKQALNELDVAMDEKCPVIVIEPMRLGDETSRWIAVGNFLHKTTVLAGVGASFAVGILPQKWGTFVWGPLALTSLTTYLTYSISWQRDPCSKYQVERNKQRLASLNLNNLSSSSVVVLQYRDDARRIMLHSLVSLVTVTVVGVRLYSMFKYS